MSSAAVLAGAPVFSSGTKTAYVAARAVGFTGTAFFYGGLAFVSVLWPAGAGARGARRLLGAGWLAGTSGTAAALGLEGAWTRQQPAGDALRGSVITAAMNTDFGRQWTALLLLWVLGLVVLADVLRRGEHAVTALPWRLGAVAVGLASVRVTDLAAHARDTAHPVVAQLADIAHLGAMCVWIGGLAMLLAGVLPRRQSEELGLVVPRYATLAMLSAVTVAASGAVLAWRVLGGVHPLTSTTYGHLVLLKIALLAAIFGVAYLSKTWVAHRLDFAIVLHRDATPVRPFVVSVATETALVVAVLAVASLVVTAIPGR